MKKFKITKEQILEIEDCGNYIVTERLKSMFPEAFKTKFTGWAKDIHEINKEWIAYYENDVLKYGINANGDWFKSKSNSNYNECESNREATEQEVKTALINEAKKIGYHNNCTNTQAIYVYDIDYNYMFFDGIKVFNKGKWAKIIETITKKKAEKLLNKKII